jgi:mannose-1-phosphate guanylyltransferase
MASTKTGGLKALVLVGGPSKGTRFRPLSLDSAKPLFPIAGNPLIFHHLDACAQLKDLREILLIGFYDDREKAWQEFLEATRTQLGVPIRYLREESRLGTAGGLMKFRKEILEGNPDYLVLLHCDIFCTFPLKELLDFHVKHGKEVSILGKQVPASEANKYGCLVVDKSTNEALHYAEKPETFVSDVINAGVYIFSPSIFELVDKVAPKHVIGESEEFLRLEQDVLMNICGDKHVYVYQTPDFWLQLKSAGMVVPCANHMLALIRTKHPEKLAKSGDGKTAPIIVGDVFIHPTAQVDPTSKIGPS